MLSLSRTERIQPAVPSPPQAKIRKLFSPWYIFKLLGVGEEGGGGGGEEEGGKKRREGKKEKKVGE